jgi:hypothetical protein
MAPDSGKESEPGLATENDDWVESHGDFLKSGKNLCCSNPCPSCWRRRWRWQEPLRRGWSIYSCCAFVGDLWQE